MTKKKARFLCPTSTRNAALLFSLLLLTAGTTLAQQAGDLGAQVDRAVADEMNKQQLPAVTVAIAQGGRVIYSKAFGKADLENDVPATTETLIRTGSLAKPITATAAMTLVEAGKLDLDAPVQNYCKEFPQKQWTITTRELLNHTSGIRHYKNDEPEHTSHYEKMGGGFALFAADPLLFEPGTKFQYTTYGYSVLGCVIEGASGEKYYDYLREHVLAPAGMAHTFVDDVFEIIPHRARGYKIEAGQRKNGGLMDSSYKIPGGGLVMSAEDFVRFEAALADGKIVKPKTLSLMWTPSRLPGLEDGKPSLYGFGFGVQQVGGEHFISHGGSQLGTSTFMALIPERRFAVAVFINQYSADPAKIVRRIFDIYRMPKP